MKAKSLSALLALVMLLAFVTACRNSNPVNNTSDPNVTANADSTQDATATPIPQIDLEDVPEYTFTEVLRIDIGSGDGEVAYSVEYGEDEYGNPIETIGMGPQDFLIRDDGSICILDSVNGRILIFNEGECIGTIGISETKDWSFGQYFDYYNGKFYIIDLNADAITVVSDPAITGNQIYETIALPNGMAVGAISSLDADVNGIRIYVSQTTDLTWEEFDYIKPHTATEFTKMPATVSQTVAEINSGEDLLIAKIGSVEWKLTKESSELFGIVGADIYGNIYMDVHRYVTNTSFIVSEKTIRAYDGEGNILGYASIDFHSWVAYSQEDIKVTSDGTVYVMNCMNGYVSIQTVTFG